MHSHLTQQQKTALQEKLIGRTPTSVLYLYFMADKYKPKTGEGFKNYEVGDPSVNWIPHDCTITFYRNLRVICPDLEASLSSYDGLIIVVLKSSIEDQISKGIINNEAEGNKAITHLINRFLDMFRHEVSELLQKNEDVAKFKRMREESVEGKEIDEHEFDRLLGLVSDELTPIIDSLPEKYKQALIQERLLSAPLAKDNKHDPALAPTLDPAPTSGSAAAPAKGVAKKEQKAKAQPPQPKGATADPAPTSTSAAAVSLAKYGVEKDIKRQEQAKKDDASPGLIESFLKQDQKSMISNSLVIYQQAEQKIVEAKIPKAGASEIAPFLSAAIKIELENFKPPIDETKCQKLFEAVEAWYPDINLEKETDKLRQCAQVQHVMQAEIKTILDRYASKHPIDERKKTEELCNKAYDALKGPQIKNDADKKFESIESPDNKAYLAEVKNRLEQLMKANFIKIMQTPDRDEREPTLTGRDYVRLCHLVAEALTIRLSYNKKKGYSLNKDGMAFTCADPKPVQIPDSKKQKIDRNVEFVREIEKKALDCLLDTSRTPAQAYNDLLRTLNSVNARAHEEFIRAGDSKLGMFYRMWRSSGWFGSDLTSVIDASIKANQFQAMPIANAAAPAKKVSS